MGDFVITTESTADLPQNLIEKFGIDTISLVFTIEGKSYREGDMPIEEFYNKMKNGMISNTSQVNPAEYSEFFEKYLKIGKDVLHVGLSSEVSGTLNSAKIAAEELNKKYLENKVVIVDSLSASLGLGKLVCLAAKEKEKGLDIDATTKWVEENKLKICHWFKIDDLNHVKRTGRLSGAAAFLGTMLGIKPVCNVDNSGKLQIVNKARGNQKVYEEMLSKMEETGLNIKDQTIFISHAGVLEEAEMLAQKIKEKFGVKEIVINYIGPTIGSHTGAGTVAVFFVGTKR